MDNTIKIIDLPGFELVGDEVILIVRPDGKHYKAQIQSLIDAILEAALSAPLGPLGIEPPKTLNQIRASSGDQGDMIQVANPAFRGAIAVYLPGDTSTPDNGSTLIVTADNKRYRITSLISLFRSPFK